MVHQIKTDSDSTLNVQKCKTTIKDHTGTNPGPDNVCLIILDADDNDKEIEAVTFLNKSQTIEFANKLLKLANELQ